MLRGDAAHGREVIGRRDDDARLALDGLEQDGDRVVGDGRLEGGRIPVGHGHETGRERREAVARLRVVREAHDRRRAAVEVAAHNDDLGRAVGHALHAVAPRASELDRRLDGFGARVHRQHAVDASEAREGLGERPEAVVVERPAREGDALELVAGGRQKIGMPVAEVHRRVGREAIEVPVAVHVGDPGALAALHDDGQGVVVVGESLVLDGDERIAGVVCGGRGGCHHRRSSRVQHFTPPPPSSSSLRSTPMGS